MNRGLFDALCLSVAFALLAGCGGSQSPIGAPATNFVGPSRARDKQVFHYTGFEQSFKAPSGVTQVRIVAKGASGGGNCGTCQAGTGGLVRATITVTPGETLYVFVGGAGGLGTGGFNGGGEGGKGKFAGYGGGGAADVREGGDALRNRVIIAAGGGGSGEFGVSSYGGGDGGGRKGDDGFGRYIYDGRAGSGGNQRRGGRGGEHSQWGYCHEKSRSGSHGDFGDGGKGGSGACDDAVGGGGGGGGYYGGGGGGGGNCRTNDCEWAGGGGGGSSYIERGATHRTDRTGGGSYLGDPNNGNGELTISW